MLLGRVGQNGVALVAVGDRVGAARQLHRGHARHRRHTFRVHFRQLLDELENIGKLAGDRVELLVLDGKARERGDVADGATVNGHGMGLEKVSGGKARKVAEATRHGQHERYMGNVVRLR